MTPEYVLKSAMLDELANCEELTSIIKGPFDTEEKIDAAFEAIEDADFEDLVADAESELRDSYTHETDLPCEDCRHYESMSVARKFGDRWVGWTYWYGGGKHGEPESVEWMEDAYFVDVKEETRVVLSFSKVEDEDRP
jgi:hypothetical protein